MKFEAYQEDEEYNYFEDTCKGDDRRGHKEDCKERLESQEDGD